jgi:hypothetical protein
VSTLQFTKDFKFHEVISDGSHMGICKIWRGFCRGLIGR